MPRVSEQYKDAQRAEILAAAGRCFARNGFHRTSMQDVFTEAGKSAGAVYRYFPKKEDLIVGVAGQNLDDVTEVLRAALDRRHGEDGDHDADGDVGDVMVDLLEAVIVHHRDRQLATIALIVWSEASRNEVLAERLSEATVDMSRAVAALVRDRQRAGTWTGVPAAALAEVIVSILPGFLLGLALRGPDAMAGFPDAARTLLRPAGNALEPDRAG